MTQIIFQDDQEVGALRLAQGGLKNWSASRNFQQLLDRSFKVLLLLRVFDKEQPQDIHDIVKVVDGILPSDAFEEAPQCSVQTLRHLCCDLIGQQVAQLSDDFVWLAEGTSSAFGVIFDELLTILDFDDE